jgi:predicted transposase/invertase (TIGR01784 family)
MKTDKLFYRIFLNQPGLLAELLPGIPPDCQFDYSAPVIKEQEFRHDGILTPLGKDPNLPLVFLEAQMQPDTDFYGRYFAETYLYLKQYKIIRPWRGLLILKSRGHDLGSEIPYQFQLDNQVQRLYLQDLLHQNCLSPNLALLQLIILPKTKTIQAAQNLLESSKGQPEFRQKLDLVEAILVNKFPNLSLEEILKMLNLKTADITQTRFYQDVFQLGIQEGEQKGRQEGRQEGEANLIIRLLNRRLGVVTPNQENQIRSLSLPGLEALGEALLDFTNPTDIDTWLNTHRKLNPQIPDTFPENDS